MTANRSLLRAGAPGTPAHRHLASSELLFVIGGVLEVLVEDDVRRLAAGDLAVVPPGALHAFAAGAEHDADLLVVFGPGTARFDYYRLLDRAHRGEAGWDEVAATQERFDNHYAESDRWRDGRPVT